MSEAPSVPQVAPFNIGANSIQVAMKAKTILDVDGKPARIILYGPMQSEITVPGNPFPFVKNGAEVIVILSVVQITPAEPTLAPRIIKP